MYVGGGLCSWKGLVPRRVFVFLFIVFFFFLGACQVQV